MSNPSTDRVRAVRVSRVIQAPRERVFEAFIDLEQRRQWWHCGPGFACTRCEIDPRIGGKYRLDMTGPERHWETVGEFREVDPPRRLVFTWTWQHLVEGDEPVEDALVTIDFIERDGATEVVIAHEGLPSEASAEEHGGGWRACFESLAQWITS